MLHAITVFYWYLLKNMVYGKLNIFNNENVKLLVKCKIVFNKNSKH